MLCIIYYAVYTMSYKVCSLLGPTAIGRQTSIDSIECISIRRRYVLCTGCAGSTQLSSWENGKTQLSTLYSVYIYIYTYLLILGIHLCYRINEVVGETIDHNIILSCYAVDVK